MKYTRTQSPSNLPKPLITENVTLFWGNDGWRYTPKLKLRHKFTDTHCSIEKWEGTMPIPIYVEKITWSLYSEKPMRWREASEHFDEVYEETPPSQKGT
jgi:hypothetical protein